MPFAAALSTNPKTTEALEEASAQARQQLQGQPDLALLFFSPHHADDAEHLAATVVQKLGVRCLLGFIR